MNDTVIQSYSVWKEEENHRSRLQCTVVVLSGGF